VNGDLAKFMDELADTVKNEKQSGAAVQDSNSGSDDGVSNGKDDCKE